MLQISHYIIITFYHLSNYLKFAQVFFDFQLHFTLLSPAHVPVPLVLSEPIVLQNFLLTSPAVNPTTLIYTSQKESF